MLGIIWWISDIAKTLKTPWFSMIFQGSGGRTWHHFLMFLGYLFRNRFLIVLGSVLGSIWELFRLPNGVYVEGFGGSGFVVDFGMVFGGGLGPL